MDDNRVIIAGGGIGGLTLALTLHQIGVECVVFEAVNELKPLGVGINLQPNAVRELFDLGFTAEDLDRFGVPAREWALVGMKGQDIYSEPRRARMRATTGRNMPCIAASFTWRSTAGSSNLPVRMPFGSAAGRPAMPSTRMAA